MATAATTKVRPAATTQAQANDKAVVEEETAGRFLYVVMMVVSFAATLAFIMFYLSLPLR
jgi:hypothetical protein